MGTEISSKWEKDSMTETLFFCKKHRTTPIKFVELREDGKLPEFKYFCEECKKERGRKK